MQEEPLKESAPTEQDLRSRISGLESSNRVKEKAITWLVIALIAGAVWTGYRNHHEAYWTIDWQEPFITHHVPTVFSENTFNYKWGKDTQNQVGWLPLDKNGKYTGLDILIPADDDTQPPQPTP